MGTVQKMVDKAKSKEALKEAMDDPDEFDFVHVDSFASRSIDSKVFIKDLLPQGELTVMFGASGSGKTFIALDIAMAIATGNYWRNGTKRTEKTGVAYIVAEGDLGLTKRIRAYRDHVLGTPKFGSDVAFRLMTASPDLMDPKNAMSIAAKVNALPEEIGLIVVDTLARTMRGDENSSQDMGMYETNCKLIHRQTGATVLLIHHTGKDKARGMRGSSTLFASSDTVLEISRDVNCRIVTAGKMRDDSDEGMRYCFNLKPVVLGLNQYGEAITSCVVEHLDDDPKLMKLKPSLHAVYEGVAHMGELQTEFDFEDLVDAVFNIKNERLIERSKDGQGYGDEKDAKKRIRKQIDEYAALPDCGIEVAGERGRITITDPDKFNL
jgi:RecA-family ATPase